MIDISKIFSHNLNKFKKNNIDISYNKSLKNYTTFKIGGPCDVFVSPKNIDELLIILNICNDNNIKYMILGLGSNLLIKDGGFRGVIISFSKFYNVTLLEDCKIDALAGASLKELALFAYVNGLKGLEFAHGIPGSVGGGVIMNAGAYDGEISQVFYSARVLTTHCKFLNLNLSQMNFGYRKSIAQEQDHIIYSTTFTLEHGDKKQIKAKIEELYTKRLEKQPLSMPSAGSIFKRPPSFYAGKLIMDAGLRGYSIGDAQVSKKHCGFIVNKGSATAKDVLMLIEHIQQTVFKLFGVMLETEVKVIGED